MTIRNNFIGRIAAAFIASTGLWPFALNAGKVGADIDRNLPSREKWMLHLRHDLLPYWQMHSALGKRPGEFPTWRYFNGEVVDPADLKREFARLNPKDLADNWLTGQNPPLRFDRTYVRMISRQAYFYCVAYHLTGEEEFLRLGKSGVDYITNSAFDPATGSFATYLRNGQKMPNVGQRTSQDLAYALLAPAFYYYLTRDKKVLEFINTGRDCIFRRYDPAMGMLRWVDEEFKDGPDDEERDRKDLVGQLDQMNAYLLTITPLLSEPDTHQWKSDLREMALAVEKFYDSEHNVFWGRIDKPHPGEYHVDFGHTIKSFVMQYFAGRLLNDNDMQYRAFHNAERVLKEAYLTKQGVWAEKENPDGSLSEDKEWWVYAELDQAAAIFGLMRPPLLNYLPHTYKFWFEKFVDHKNGEVWHMVEKDGRTDRYPKAHLWKSGFHSAEHCLIGYITSQAARRQTVELYFAFRPNELPLVVPYYLKAETSAVAERTPLSPRLNGLEKVRIVFSGVN
jgi:mannose/cellobiose epimerase-like protein (N-acyl-D-glucosamine 2-epimerase family)